MNREDLRPCIVTRKDGTAIKGYFHKWVEKNDVFIKMPYISKKRDVANVIRKTSSDYNILPAESTMDVCPTTVALVELEDGSVDLISLCDFSFSMDLEPKKQSYTNTLTSTKSLTDSFDHGTFNYFVQEYNLLYCFQDSSYEMFDIDYGAASTIIIHFKKGDKEGKYLFKMLPYQTIEEFNQQELDIIKSAIKDLDLSV